MDYLGGTQVIPEVLKSERGGRIKPEDMGLGKSGQKEAPLLALKTDGQGAKPHSRAGKAREPGSLQELPERNPALPTP